MKRTLSMFGALAVAAGFFLFGAPAANATHNGTPAAPAPSLGCTLVNDLNVFPRNAHYYYCGTNSTIYKNPAANTFTTLPSHLRTKLYDANTYLFVWDTVTEMNTYHGTSEPLIDTGGFSLKFPIFPSSPFYGVNVFETIQPAFQGPQSPSQGTFEQLIVHEQGHALDNAYGTPSENPSSVFRTTLTSDWAAVNALPQSTVFPHGIPPKKATLVNGVWTWVTYTPPPVGTPNRNQIIIQDLMPAFTDPGEMFALLYSQFRSKVTDVMNPYTDSATLSGHTLSLIEVLRNFSMTKQAQTPKRYFDKMWSNHGFMP